MYEGRPRMEPGRIFGHENLGTVIQAGSAVDRVKPGDRVCMPFSVACGFCENRERGLTGFCLTTNPGNAGAAYGYAGMGDYNCGQAKPVFIISRELPLDRAAEAYKNFDARKEGWTKVVLKPGL